MNSQSSSSARRTYRVAEVSQMLGVPKPTIYRWISEGNLPVMQVGRVLLVPVKAIDQLLRIKHPADFESATTTGDGHPGADDTSSVAIAESRQERIRGA